MDKNKGAVNWVLADKRIPLRLTFLSQECKFTLEVASSDVNTAPSTELSHETKPDP